MKVPNKHYQKHMMISFYLSKLNRWIILFDTKIFFRLLLPFFHVLYALIAVNFSEPTYLAIASVTSGLKNHSSIIKKTRLTIFPLFSIFLLYLLEFSRLLSTSKQIIIRFSTYNIKIL